MSEGDKGIFDSGGGELLASDSFSAMEADFGQLYEELTRARAKPFAMNVFADRTGWRDVYLILASDRDLAERGNDYTCRPCDVCHAPCEEVHPHVMYHSVSSSVGMLSIPWYEGYCSEACSIIAISRREAEPMTPEQRDLALRWRAEIMEENRRWLEANG